MDGRAEGLREHKRGTSHTFVLSEGAGSRVRPAWGTFRPAGAFRPLTRVFVMASMAARGVSVPIFRSWERRKERRKYRQDGREDPQEHRQDRHDDRQEGREHRREDRQENLEDRPEDERA